MEGEPRVLQQRVHVMAVDRRHRQPLERVGSQQGEQQEPGGRRPQHADHPRPQRARQIAAEPGDRPAAQRQDQRPEDDGAFVVPPGAGDLIDQRLHAVAVLRHVQHGEIVRHMGPDQAERRRRQCQQLPRRQSRRRRDQPLVAPLRAPYRQDRLRKRKCTSQRQCKMAQLRNHKQTPAKSPLPPGEGWVRVGPTG